VDDRGAQCHGPNPPPTVEEVGRDERDTQSPALRSHGPSPHESPGGKNL
jgi:hypothetical protein